MLDAVVLKHPAAFLFVGCECDARAPIALQADKERAALAFRQSQNCRIAGPHSIIGAEETLRDAHSRGKPFE